MGPLLVVLLAVVVNARAQEIELKAAPLHGNDDAGNGEDAITVMAPLLQLLLRLYGVVNRAT